MGKGFRFPEKRKTLTSVLLITVLLLLSGVFFVLHRKNTPPILRLSETEEAFLLPGKSFEGQTPAPNPYDQLSVPTYITKIDGTYFIVDCYHDQIIYSDSLTKPLSQWLVMTDEIRMGHTLAGDGTVFLADDTENNRVLIYEKKAGVYVHTQTFSDIGIRPHYVIYRNEDRLFYVWSSMTGEMYLFGRIEGSDRVALRGIRRIPALNGCYVRSFTILGDDIYFVSGNASIIRADLDSFKIKEIYPVPDSMAGMIQISLIDGYYYITVSTDAAGSQSAATILRTKDLGSLISGGYEDVYDVFIGGGTPYYITCFDGLYYLTEHRLPGHSVWSFRSEQGELCDVKAVY